MKDKVQIIDPYKEIKQALLDVHNIIGDECDWIIIKKQMLRTLTPQVRKFFSTRDPITKEQSMNGFDIQIAMLWSKMTNKPVVFKDETISAP
jgi:hypothetical protein